MRDLALAPPSAPPLTGGLADSLFARAAESPTLPVLARRTGAPPFGRRSAPSSSATRSSLWPRA